MTQKQLSFLPPAPIHFDGMTYQPKHDQIRLSSQLRRVFECRKARAGFHEVQRRRVAGGVFEYKLVVNPVGERLIA